MYYSKKTNGNDDERIGKIAIFFPIEKKKIEEFENTRWAFSTNFGQNSRSQHLLRNYKYVPRRSIL